MLGTLLGINQPCLWDPGDIHVHLLRYLPFSPLPLFIPLSLLPFTPPSLPPFLPSFSLLLRGTSLLNTGKANSGPTLVSRTPSLSSTSGFDVCDTLFSQDILDDVTACPLGDKGQVCAYWFSSFWLPFQAKVLCCTCPSGSYRMAQHLAFPPS